MILPQYSSTPLTSLGKIMREQNERLAALDREEDALYAPIRERIDQIRGSRMHIRNQLFLTIEEELEKLNFEDLADPLRALEVYAAFWSDGRGVSNHRYLYRRIFGDSYVANGDLLSYGSQNDLYYIAPQIEFPKGPGGRDEAKLLRTAELVEKVHRVNMEILGEYQDAKIAVVHGDYMHDREIVLDRSSSEWVLLGSFNSIPYFHSPDLTEVLRKIPVLS